MPRPDGERGRHIELPTHDLLAGLVDGVLRAASQRAGQVALAIRAQLRADAKESRDRSGLEQIAPMLIDATL